MSKINFNNKVAVNQNTSVPDENKCNSTDLNSLKKAVNQIGSFNTVTVGANAYQFKVNLEGTLTTGDVVNVLFPTSTNTSNTQLSVNNGTNYYNIYSKSGNKLETNMLSGRYLQLYFNGTDFVLNCPLKLTMWTNASPTSNFATQTINITYNMSKIDKIDILLDTFTPYQNYLWNTVSQSNYDYLLSFSLYSSNSVIRQRSISYSTNYTITFGNATQNGATDNTKMIPIKIIGYIE